MRKGLIKLIIVIGIAAGSLVGLGSTALARPNGRPHLATHPLRPAPAQVAAAPTPPAVSTTSEPLRVLLTGDSLTHEAGGAFATAMTSTGRADVDTTLVYGGTAICDWIPRLDAKLQQFRPQVAVVEFSGNSLTPCMIDPATATRYTGDAYVEKYRDDANAAMEIFTRYGVTVYWVEAPINRTSSARPLAPVYRTLPWAWANAHYVNGGAAVLDHGDYVEYLPCLAAEPCTDTDPATGQPAAKVRAPDGAHFCPVAPEARNGVTGVCPVWSSGAWRFGTAMATPVIEDYALATSPTLGA